MGSPDHGNAISVRDLVVGFGERTILDHLSLDVRQGEIIGLVGASGGGKSVLLRTIIGLIPKRSGTISIMGGDDVAESFADETGAAGRRLGVLFQQGALFSSLNVRQNVQFPMRENLKLSDRLLDELATAKLEMVGLSAGRRRQVSLRTVRRHDQARRAGARTGARSGDRLPRRNRPSGLDPISAGDFDSLIKTLQRTLGFYRVHGDARSRQPAHGLRPDRGTCGRKESCQSVRFRTCWRRPIRGLRHISEASGRALRRQRQTKADTWKRAHPTL